MTVREFGAAIDHAVEIEMTADPRVIVLGEDVPMLRRGLLSRFGPGRVIGTPISESAFLGAAVTAAMGGLRPIVELQLIDFVAVGLSALLNEAAKVEAFSGGRWKVPLVVRATCGGGYGDGGQHEQALWGMLAGIPGLSVVVPSNPADAAGLMRSAVAHDGPVVFLEHKLLSRSWLEVMGGARRDTANFDVPEAGTRGEVAAEVPAVPIGRAAVAREGTDLVLVSLAVGVHRALQAAELLAEQGTSAAVLDLRSAAPLDRRAIAAWAGDTGRVVAIDEDYLAGGLTGEVAAAVLGSGSGARFARVACEGTIPYARHLEDEVLPNVGRIMAAAGSLLAE